MDLMGFMKLSPENVTFRSQMKLPKAVDKGSRDFLHLELIPLVTVRDNRDYTRVLLYSYYTLSLRVI